MEIEIGTFSPKGHVVELTFRRSQSQFSFSRVFFFLHEYSSSLVVCLCVSES